MSPSGPLRIMVVIDSFGQGGAEHSLAAMLPKMSSLGIDAEVVCRTSADGDLADELRATGVPVTIVPDASPLAAARWLRSRIRSVRPDAVHLNLFVPMMIGSAAAIGADVPVVVSIVSTTADTDPEIATWKLRVVTALEGFVCRRACAMVHAVTDGVAQVVRRDLGVSPDKIRVAERGRSSDRFRPAVEGERAAIRRGLGVADEAEVVIAVGRHVYPKGFDVLLEAIAALQVDRPGLVTLIPGNDGPMSNQLRQQVRSLPRPDDVHLLGERSDVDALLRTADVYVMSSRREGAAGAVLEAMASAVPIVATDLEGTAGVLHDEHDALLVPVEQPLVLAEAVARLLDDRDLAAALGSAGRQEFSERFSIERAVDSLAGIYRSTAGERGASVRSVVLGR